MHNDQEIHLQGFPICPGIAIGKPFFFSLLDEKIPEFSVPDHEIDKEIARYQRALKSSRQDVLTLQEQLQVEGVTEGAAILDSHLEMMKDPLMTVRIEEEIRATRKNTEFIFYSVIGEYEEKFNKINDRFFRERLKDIHDISRRIIGYLRHNERLSLVNIPTQSIIFAHELTPSDTAEANTECIEAFVTRTGSETSHVAIMARAKGIPFVTSVDFPDFFPMSAKQVIVDGRTGLVIINPTKKTLEVYRKDKKKLSIQLKGLNKTKNLEAETLDGLKVKISANIELFNELDTLPEYGSDGVGLFRSEYIFLSKDAFPSEEEQFIVYRNIVERMNGLPIVIRTFDIGGDKFGNFHPNRFEVNPYLGCRAIRFMLKERSAFKTQICAILRASQYGNISILFPLITSVSELRQIKILIQEVLEELRSRGIEITKKVPLGCMIEVPSAALTCDLIAQEGCDFFSIGTNDLVQYTLAVDRGNPSMSYLYNPHHPSILRLIRMIVVEGERLNIPISICGEIAANPSFTALLIGLGVKELSVVPSQLLVIKDMIRQISLEKAKELSQFALTLKTEEEIEACLQDFYHQFKPNK